MTPTNMHPDFLFFPFLHLVPLEVNEDGPLTISNCFRVTPRFRCGDNMEVVAVVFGIRVVPWDESDAGNLLDVSHGAKNLRSFTFSYIHI
jgi:hypothetical protein